MNDTTVIIVTVSALLVLGGLALAFRQGINERRQLAGYSAAHGWAVAAKPDAQLTHLLAEFDSSSGFYPRNVMTVEPPPSPIYFFHNTRRPKDRPSNQTTGYSCFSRYGGRRFEGKVEIFNRTPGVEKLIGGRAHVGSDEFQKAFTVTEQVPGTAAMTVNRDLERVMMDHAAGPGWYVNVEIANGGILVSSSWAQSPVEWDHLIDLTKQIREVVR